MKPETEANLKQKKSECDALKCRLLPSARLFVVVLIGFGGGTMMMTRMNISVAVVCMVSDVTTNFTNDVITNVTNGVTTDVMFSSVVKTVVHSNLTEISLEDLENITADEDFHQEQHRHQGEFGWSKTFQALLLSSYFYGYTAVLVPGGWISDRFPAQRVILLSVATQGLLTVIFPAVVRYNAYASLVLRTLQGVVTSVVLPATIVLIRNWSTPDEYSLLFSVAWAHHYLMAGLSYPISGFICDASGWPAIFYISGGLPIAWALLAWMLLSETPNQSLFCPEKESRWLEVNKLYRIPTITSASGKEKRAPTPLLAIFINRQVWIIVGTFFFYTWFLNSINITLPMFLEETMGLSLSENGVLSGLPNVCNAVGVLIGGRLLHYLLTRWQFSRTNARKLIATVSMLVPAALVGGILMLPPGSKYATMVLMCVANLIGVSGVAGGPLSAGPDIGPQYAGIIWGLAGSIGNLTGLLTPLIAALMTPNKTLTEWHHFFLISVVALVFMDLVIVFFWRSEIQPFAIVQDSTNDNTNKSKKKHKDGNKEQEKISKNRKNDFEEGNIGRGIDTITGEVKYPQILEKTMVCSTSFTKNEDVKK